MAKYANWGEMEKNVPLAYKESATDKAFQRGMTRIAPTGMRVKEARVTNYRNGVEDKADLVIERYKRAMFEQS